MSRSISVTQVCTVRCEPPSCQRPPRVPALLTLARRRHRHCGSLPLLSPANCHASTTFFAASIGADDMRTEFASAAVIAAHHLLFAENGVAEQGVGGAGHRLFSGKPG